MKTARRTTSPRRARRPTTGIRPRGQPTRIFSHRPTATEWVSVVVPIPTDFAVTGSKVGVQIHATGSGTIKLYVDSLFFDR